MLLSSKTTKPVCVGLDVHKNNVWACVCTENPTDTMHFKTRKFASNHSDLTSMCEWIRSTAAKALATGKAKPFDAQSPIDVYMESTGKYSTPVYNVCEEMGLNPYMVNPKHVKTIAGQKTDQKDCAWIAELGCRSLLRTSYIPDLKIRQSRRLSRTRTKLVHYRGDEMRRIQNILTEANIRLDLIFSGIQGQSARNVIEYLIETDEPVLEEIQARILKTCRIMRFSDEKERKEKEEELVKAFSGARFSSSQKFELQSAYERIDHYSEQIKNYEYIMRETLDPFKEKLELLETIPGISRLSAMQILSEIGADMEAFASEKSFISWCGLCPQSNQSNNKHKSVKIGKGGYYLKPVLIQCALNAIKNPYYEAKYKAIAARRGKKRALIAIARKMMIAAYPILLNGEMFRPSDSRKEEGPVTEADETEQEFVSLEDEEKEEAIQQTAYELIALSKESSPALMKKVEELLSQIGLMIPTVQMASVPSKFI